MRANIERSYEARKAMKAYTRWRNTYVIELKTEVWAMSDRELEIRKAIHSSDSEVIEIIKKQQELRVKLSGRFFPYYFY